MLKLRDRTDINAGVSAEVHGQTLVEFALVLTVFMVVTIGIVDAVRVIFFFSQIQEAAREGARWGAVQVGRGMSDGTTPWYTFMQAGNRPGQYTYFASVSDAQAAGCVRYNTPSYSNGPVWCYTPWDSPSSITWAPIPNSIIGAVTQATQDVNLTDASVTITTNVSYPVTATLSAYNDQITNRPVSVSVKYPFKPILGIAFKAVINLTGTSTMLHE